MQCTKTRLETEAQDNDNSEMAYYRLMNILYCYNAHAVFVAIRKSKLEANRLLQIFLVDYRDLMAWMTDLATRISSGEPAKNVREAEALLELHTERKVQNCCLFLWCCCWW